MSVVFYRGLYGRHIAGGCLRAGLDERVSEGAGMMRPLMVSLSKSTNIRSGQVVIAALG